MPAPGMPDSRAASWKAGPVRHAPRAWKRTALVFRFVGVIFIEEAVGGMRLLHQAGQLGTKRIDLPIVEDLDPARYPCSLNEAICSSESRSFCHASRFFRLLEKLADRCVRCGQVHGHQVSPRPFRVSHYRFFFRAAPRPAKDHPGSAAGAQMPLLSCSRPLHPEKRQLDLAMRNTGPASLAACIAGGTFNRFCFCD